MFQVKSILFIAILSMAFSGCGLFEEPQKLPVVKIASASNITSSSFRIGGKIESSENHSKKGFFLGTQSNPSEGSGTELVVDSFGNDFSLSVKKLSADTRYYIRAFARNGTGIGYSENKEITTLPGVCPTVNTKPLIITGQEIKSGGSITDNGGMPILAKGICWSASGEPGLGQGNFTSENEDGDDFSSTIPVINPAQNVFIRAYATNAKGTCYGEVFRTVISPPSLITSDATNITSTTAASGGTISSDGGAAILAKGICWSKSPNPTISSNEGKTDDGAGGAPFISAITKLEPYKTYYIRAYATNSAGTNYGSQKAFTTTSLKDVDGNTYPTVKIGQQLWMKENLKTSKYRNGDPIFRYLNDNQWENASKGAYIPYGGYTASADTFGYLYNWYAVADSRGLCPVGWRIPTNNDWDELISQLGASAGGQMKSVGVAFWAPPNSGATNTSGFSALPGGYREQDGIFFNKKFSAHWWSGSADSGNYVDIFRKQYQLYWNQNSASSNYSQLTSGLSVRCLRE